MNDPWRWPLRISHSLQSNWRGQLRSKLYEDGTFHLFTDGVVHERPEFGTYVHALGRERAHEFRAFFEGLGAWELPDLDIIEPDRPTVDFAELELGREGRAKMWAIEDHPPEVQSIMVAFHKLVDEALASPVQVLTGSARWSAPQFSAREPLQLEFTLTNRGTESISIGNPMAEAPYRKRLLLLVSPVPTAEAPRPELTRIAIDPTLLSRPDPSKPHDAGPNWLPLAPGQSSSFAATPAAYLSPGEHRAALLFDTELPGERPRDRLCGVLAVDLPPLRIVDR